MGKIIRNGIEYSGTYDSATSVNYDNSVSGLNANTVQEGVDELANGLRNTSVVDNLLSTSTTLPLSANQGRILNESLGGLRFGTNGDGTYGYYGADGSLIPFKSGGASIIYLGEASNSATYYVKSNYADYTKLTESNFMVEITKYYNAVRVTNWSGVSVLNTNVTRTISKSYNASTGSFSWSISATSGCTGQNLSTNTINVYAKVYLVV